MIAPILFQALFEPLLDESCVDIRGSLLVALLGLHGCLLTLLLELSDQFILLQNFFFQLLLSLPEVNKDAVIKFDHAGVHGVHLRHCVCAHRLRRLPHARADILIGILQAR